MDYYIGSEQYDLDTTQVWVNELAEIVEEEEKSEVGTEYNDWAESQV